MQSPRVRACVRARTDVCVCVPHTLNTKCNTPARFDGNVLEAAMLDDDVIVGVGVGVGDGDGVGNGVGNSLGSTSVLLLV